MLDHELDLYPYGLQTDATLAPCAPEPATLTTWGSRPRLGQPEMVASEHWDPAPRASSPGRLSVLVIRVCGSMDLWTVPPLKDRLVEVAQEPNLAVLLDLTAVEFIDAAGLGAVVTGYKRLRETGGSLRVRCRRGGTVHRLLGITRLEMLVAVELVGA